MSKYANVQVFLYGSLIFNRQPKFLARKLHIGFSGWKLGNIFGVDGGKP